MAKWILGLMACCLLTAYADNDSTVDILDQLERQRLILEKQVEVSKLQKELSDNAGRGARLTSTQDLTTSALSLVKILGLSNKPTAVFLYNGYRISALKGAMVLPNVQLKNINENYVVLNDTSTGQESILWLSAH